MIKQKIFQKIHTGNLVYNTCWEDPRCDRALLQLDQNSKVVMLTSAGCNALDYLLDTPKSIDCIDMNPRQNALLQLKCALFKAGNHEALNGFFGQGKFSQAQTILKDALQYNMDDFSATYWKKQIGVFSGKGLRKSFYYHGSAGLVAFLFSNFLKTDPKVARTIHAMFETDDIFQQRMLYYRIEPVILNRFAVWALNTHVVQSMLGVPSSQQDMARHHFKDGMTGYFRKCLRKVFTELTLQDNYFWSLYFFGQYNHECSPNYLKKQYFETIKSQVPKINTHTTTLSGFLKANNNLYSHLILLDHQDWLAANDQSALNEEWQLILENTAPGAKVLLRSAAPNRDFIPDFVAKNGYFSNVGVSEQHLADRVGTYASAHLFIRT
jgi:S-adenosylmethionine-diacylglycerol 3-amino-3-carboxypropyl transferase